MEQKQPNGHDAIHDSQAASTVARDKLMSELKNAIGEAETWLKDAAAQDSITDSETRARFNATLNTARNDLRQLEDSLLAGSRSLLQSCDGYVREHPWKAVGLVAAAGFLFGMLVANNKRY